MAFETSKETFNINQIIASKNQDAVVESDCIVPDIKPDLLQVVNTSGIVNVYKKELSDGKMRIDGSVLAYVMYVGSDGKKKSVKSISHSIDFSQIIGIDDAKSDMNDICDVSLKQINCKIINERKVNIKADLNFNIQIFKNSNIENISDVKIDDLQKLEKKIDINTIVGIGNTKANISEKINCDSKIQDILSVNTNINNIESKISINKVLEKANFDLKILYLSTDNKINIIKKTFPIMGFIDVNNIKNDNICSPSFEINNILVKPNGTEDTSISIDVDINISLIVYENKQINIIQDMYSPSKNLKFTKSTVSTTGKIIVVNGTYNFQHKESLNIGDNTVCDIDTNLKNIVCTINGNIANIDATAHFNVLCADKNNLLSMKKVDVPINYKLNIPNNSPLDQNSIVIINYNILNENFNVMPGGEIDFRMDINFFLKAKGSVSVDLINDTSEDTSTQNEMYNIVIYYTKGNESLWEIAKKYRSTPANIMKMSNLKSDQLTPGTQLFITR